MIQLLIHVHLKPTRITRFLLLLPLLLSLLHLLLLLVSVCPSLNITVDRLHFLQNGEAYEQVASITAACTSKLPRLFRPQAIIRACSFGARARATDRANVKYRVFLKHVGSTMDTDEYDKRGKNLPRTYVRIFGFAFELQLLSCSFRMEWRMGQGWKMECNQFVEIDGRVFLAIDNYLDFIFQGLGSSVVECRRFRLFMKWK